jgi:hypothetical protein
LEIKACTLFDFITFSLASREIRRCHREVIVSRVSNSQIIKRKAPAPRLGWCAIDSALLACLHRVRVQVCLTRTIYHHLRISFETFVELIKARDIVSPGLILLKAHTGEVPIEVKSCYLPQGAALRLCTIHVGSITVATVRATRSTADLIFGSRAVLYVMKVA